MIKLRSLIYEQTISSTDYTQTSNEELWDLYFIAKKAYDAQVLRAQETPINAVDAATTLATSGVDMTRPIYTADKDGTRGSSIYLPARGYKIPTKQFWEGWEEAENNGTLDKYREYTGYTDESFQSGQTSDNTCAQFVCTAYDMGNADTDDNIGGLLKNQKDRDWVNAVKPGGWLGDTEGDYQSSPYKIKRFTICDKAVHPGNWDKYSSDDFEGDNRSVEWWNQNIQPGDLIMYKHPNGKYSHVVIAGNNPLELFQDGSTNKTPGERHETDNHANTRLDATSFDIIRYTNKTNITDAKTRLDNIESELNSRSFTLPINKITQMPTKTSELEPIKMSTELPDIEVTPGVTKKKKPGLFKKIYNSVKGLGDPDKFWS